MNYIVFDLEWNQASTVPGTNEKIPFEIIEIGSVKLNSDRVMVDQFSQLIKPQIYNTMHYMTGKLVHLKMQELAHERPFKEVMSDFLSWCGTDYIFVTWGPLDLLELQRNMVYYGFKPLSDGPLPFYDAQKLYAIECDKVKERKALETVVDILNIEKDIPFHRAFSDAYYTAKVFSHLKEEETFKHYSYDNFVPPKNKASEIHASFSDYEKYISRTFSSRFTLLSDKEVKDINCYKCIRPSKKIVKPFTPNNKFYLGLSFCPKHGFVKSKIRIRKSEDGRFFAVKTKKLIENEEAQSIINRAERQKKEKKRK